MSWEGRVGWCPSVATPMAASDGLLVRVKPTAATLPAKALRAVAQAAGQYGNGRIDLTNRANLQVRGLRPETAEAFAAIVREHGLASAEPALEEVRNVAADPLGADDPEATFDSHAIARSIDAMLAETRPLRALPPKFGFLVDCGRTMPVPDTHADIVIRDRDGTLAVGLGGGTTALPCTPEDAPDLARRLALTFLELAGPSHRPPYRMRELVELVGETAILAKARLAGRPDWAPDRVRGTSQDALANANNEGATAQRNGPRVPDLIRDPEATRGAPAYGTAVATTSSLSTSCPGPSRASTNGGAAEETGDGRDGPGHDDGGELLDPTRAAHLALMYAPAPADSPVGYIPFPGRDAGAVVAGVPRGRIVASTLAALADLSERFADATVRMTPWRALAFVPEGEDNAAACLSALADLDLITDPNDPRRRLRGPDIAPAAGAKSIPETISK